MATASNRTMVFNNDASSWQYSKKGWTAAFKPITNCSFAQFKVFFYKTFTKYLLIDLNKVLFITGN